MNHSNRIINSRSLLQFGVASNFHKKFFFFKFSVNLQSTQKFDTKIEATNTGYKIVFPSKNAPSI